MLARTIIKEIQKKGPIYVEVMLSKGGDPVEVMANKKDIIEAYRAMFDPDDETGMMVGTDRRTGCRYLVQDDTGETSGK